MKGLAIQPSHTIMERFRCGGAGLKLSGHLYSQSYSQFQRRRLCNNMTFRPARASPFSEIMDENTIHRRPDPSDYDSSNEEARRSFDNNPCYGYLQRYHRGSNEASYSFNPRNEESRHHQGSTMTHGYHYPPAMIQNSTHYRPSPSYPIDRPYTTPQWQQYPTSHRRTSWANYDYFGFARAESPSMTNSEETLPASNTTASRTPSKYVEPYHNAGGGTAAHSNHYYQDEEEAIQRREIETFSPPPLMTQTSNTEGGHSPYCYSGGAGYAEQGNAYVADEPEIPPPPKQQHHSKTVHAGQLVGSLQPLDITCGRGAPTNFHYGNQVFRELVEGYQTAYLCAKRSDKPDIAMKLLDIVKERGGRFVRRRKAAGHFSWETIGDKGAYEKVCQALRDGAPDLRRQMLSTSSINKGQTKNKKKVEEGAGDIKLLQKSYQGENKEPAKENNHRNIMRAQDCTNSKY